MHTFQHLYRYTFLTLLLILFSIIPCLATWHHYFLDITEQGENEGLVRITTNVRLNAKEGAIVSTLPSPIQYTLNDDIHYVFIPGRADHAEKFLPFFEKFLEYKKDAKIWCIDPYGQGGSSGSVRCEAYDESSPQPCCRRKGHGTWDDYMRTYVKSISAINSCLNSTQLTVIAHSMSANIDMCARLHPEYKGYLEQRIGTLHYVAPMVNYTLFLKDKVGESVEYFARYALAWVAYLSSYRDSYFFTTEGPINAFNLQNKDVETKIHSEKAEDFIAICKQNATYEIGSPTNQWFYEAHTACNKTIWEITPNHFNRIKLHVHVPGDDKVVYPHWVTHFFQSKDLKHELHEYPNEPHNLFWGSDESIISFIKNITASNSDKG